MSILWHSSSRTGIDTVKSSIPAMVRRKLTPFGRLAVEKLYEAYNFLDAHGSVSEIPWVIASRHGDPDRIYRLLGDVAASQLISPMDFSQSVHNALIGSFSIATKNKAPHTAISSGRQSFESGFLESFVQQKTQGGFVGYLYYDMAMSTEYNDLICDNHLEKPTFIAMILGPDDTQIKGGTLLKINYHGQKEAPGPTTTNIIDQIMLLLNGTSKKISFAFGGGEFHIEHN